MNTRVNLGFARFAQIILVLFLLCVTAIISSNTYANAQVGGENNNVFENASTERGSISAVPVPGGPGYIMISPFDFRPYSQTDQWKYSNSGLYNPSTTAYSSLVAGLTLPHGATITKLTLYYKDNLDGPNLSLSLSRGNAEDSLGFMVFLQTDDAAEGFRYMSSASLPYPKVDNQSYGYFLNVEFSPSGNNNLMLTNVRIDYEYTVYTPNIMK